MAGATNISGVTQQQTGFQHPATMATASNENSMGVGDVTQHEQSKNSVMVDHKPCYELIKRRQQMLNETRQMNETLDLVQTVNNALVVSSAVFLGSVVVWFLTNV